MLSQKRKAIARAVRVALIDRPVSQYDIATAFGRSQAAVSRRISGQVDFSAPELSELADLIGVPVTSFFADDAERRPVARKQSSA